MAKESKESQQLDPYAAVLADLRSKRDQIDQAIKMIEGMAGIAAGSPTSMPSFAAAMSEEPGAFLGMTVADATVKLLTIRKKPLSNPEIVTAIRAGGVILNSAEPVNTVGSILRRRQTDQGDIVRVGRTWGLAEWYPNAGRFARRGQKELKEAKKKAPLQMLPKPKKPAADEAAN